MPANTRRDSTLRSSRSTRSRARSARWSGEPVTCRVQNEVNMALLPRQTGSSIKLFILAAALQAGVQPTDLIDGTMPCTLPNPGDPKDPFVITSGESQPVVPLATPDVVVDQLRVRRARARSSGCTASSTRPTGWPVRRTSTSGRRPSEADDDRAVRQLRHRRQRDGPDRHGVRDADDRQPGAAPRSVLRRDHRPGRRQPVLHPPGRRHAGARPRRRAHRAVGVEGRAHPWHGALGAARRSPVRPPARPARRTTTPTPGSSGAPRSWPRRCGSAIRTATSQ